MALGGVFNSMLLVLGWFAGAEDKIQRGRELADLPLVFIAAFWPWRERKNDAARAWDDSPWADGMVEGLKEVKSTSRDVCKANKLPRVTLRGTQ